ncbi:uncharacterized protein LOC143535493 [Bidens hawaiensis]|uniref:uncharacterized protein LOC143535493 n=1 Tax=Bidens hawaiensis TaxID=980011 RepID=UPI0040499E6A
MAGKNNESVKEAGPSMTLQCPILNSTNYTIWAVKIIAIFGVHGISEVLEEEKGAFDVKKNRMAIACLFQAMPEEIVLQVAHHKKVADTWADLKAHFVGAEMIKEARLQTLESEFEALKMKDTDTIDDFTGKISPLVSQANNLGSTIDYKNIVRKLLESVPKKYIQIVAAIEQFADLNTILFQEAIGRLKAYEERIKESTEEEDKHNKLMFTNTSGKEKFKEHKCKHCGNWSSNQGNFRQGRGKGCWYGKSKDGEQAHEDKGHGKLGEPIREDKSHVRCHKCNELGHCKSECPKWKDQEAHLVWSQTTLL